MHFEFLTSYSCATGKHNTLRFFLDATTTAPYRTKQNRANQIRAERHHTHIHTYPRTLEAPATAASATRASACRAASTRSRPATPPTAPSDRPIRPRSRPRRPVDGCAMALRAGMRFGSFLTRSKASSLARESSCSSCTASAFVQNDLSRR